MNHIQTQLLNEHFHRFDSVSPANYFPFIWGR